MSTIVISMRNLRKVKKVENWIAKIKRESPKGVSVYALSHEEIEVGYPAMSGLIAHRYNIAITFIE